MTEILVSCAAPKPVKVYEYKREKSYKARLNWRYMAYNKDMKPEIKISQKSHISYSEIDQYLRKISKKFTHIQIDEKKLNGMPAIKNTRIPVSLVVACLKDEMTFEEICEEYKLKREEIETAMEYVIEILDIPYQEG